MLSIYVIKNTSLLCLPVVHTLIHNQNNSSLSLIWKLCLGNFLGDSIPLDLMRCVILGPSTSSIQQPMRPPFWRFLPLGCRYLSAAAIFFDTDDAIESSEDLKRASKQLKPVIELCQNLKKFIFHKMSKKYYQKHKNTPVTRGL
jgi:hypothetical protein